MKKLTIVTALFLFFILSNANNVHAQSSCGNAPGGEYGPGWWQAYQAWCRCVGGTLNLSTQSCTPGSQPGPDDNSIIVFSIVIVVVVVPTIVGVASAAKKAKLRKLEIPVPEPPIMSRAPFSKIPANPKGTLTHADALKQITDAGIKIHSSGECSDRNDPLCTSLDGIRQETVNEVIDFKNSFGGNVTITGGTEVGHSTKGNYSHRKGYKVDIRDDDEIGNYIRSRYAKQVPPPKFAVEQYKAPNGSVYSLEVSSKTGARHWDIVIKH